MKLVFDRHKISIPYPQIVVNHPPEFKEATAWEKYKAERFAREQRDVAGNLIEDEEEDS